MAALSTEGYPAIIREAATSPLGILALIILLLASLAVAFFGKSSEQIRLRVWITFFVGGALLFGLAVLRESGQSASADPPRHVDRPVSGDTRPETTGEPLADQPAGEPRGPSRGTIQVAYSGDMYSCSLPVTIEVGDRSFQPQGQLARLDQVPLGLQGYRVVGSIQCPYLVSCTVDSRGTIEIAAGRTYYLGWQQTGPGRCDAMLQAS